MKKSKVQVFEVIFSGRAVEMEGTLAPSYYSKTMSALFEIPVHTPEGSIRPLLASAARLVFLDAIEAFVKSSRVSHLTHYKAHLLKTRDWCPTINLISVLGQ